MNARTVTFLFEIQWNPVGVSGSEPIPAMPPLPNSRQYDTVRVETQSPSPHRRWFEMQKTQVFFRNDDVNRPEPGLRETTELLLKHGIPVSHAVEPANLQEDTRRWLTDLAGSGVEIVQHGFAHAKHDRGEFGGDRSAEDQFQDLECGLRIMEDAFGDLFFPAMSFPFGSYNEFTIPLLDRLGYRVVSCHRRHQFSRQVFYGLGRLLRRGRWLDRHVSHHLKHYPGTRVLEVSVTLSPIRTYLPDQGDTACTFHSQGDLQRMFLQCRRQSPVVGIVLHHRFHAEPGRLQRLEEFLLWLEQQPDLEFADLNRIHDRWQDRTGTP